MKRRKITMTLYYDDEDENKPLSKKTIYRSFTLSNNALFFAMELLKDSLDEYYEDLIDIEQERYKDDL